MLSCQVFLTLHVVTLSELQLVYHNMHILLVDVLVDINAISVHHTHHGLAVTISHFESS